MLGRSFYVFTGIHSLLIGLFPFYIPVYLYTIGLTLSRICIFVAITGVGFCLALFLWDRVCRRVSFRFLIICSFLSEFLLLSMFFLEKDFLFLLFAGLANGFFNCNFWVIQRLLFVRSTGPQNSGRNFGNSQFFVLIVLKAGILIGGFLLEKTGFMTLYLISAGIVLLSVLTFSSWFMDGDTNGVIKSAKPISILSTTRFKDRWRSRSVFGIDGVFLYLESYYWVISLFIIVRENFLKLGLVVIILAILFGVVFLFIKSNIDRLPKQRMYIIAVILYSLSWALRGILSENIDAISTMLLLALVALCTTVFRLTFNKRFFDNAKSTRTYEYILMKSYYSQFFLALFFVILAWILAFPGSILGRLSWLYYFAAIVSFSYLLYRTSGPTIVEKVLSQSFNKS